MARHLAVNANLLSAAGYLCCAVDDLRAAGLGTLADEIDAFIAILDARIESLIATPKGRSLRRTGARARAVGTQA
jgi:hypothetical protein